MRIRTIALSVTAPLTLSGCFFFFHVPNTPPDAAGNWNACINQYLVVGERTRTPNGHGTIKAIFGSSPRCTSSTPTLAEVAYD
jgi:hypothetical protein